MAQIVITAAANGWIVRTPFQEEGIAYPGPQAVQFRTQARIMREEFQKDEMLEAAAGRTEIKKLDQVMEEIKEKNVYTFKTFPEVLAFLAKEMRI